MTEDYTIEQLENTFKEHAEQYEIDEKERFDKAVRNGDMIPIVRHFNLSKALHVICREINYLKRTKQDNILSLLGNLPID